MAIIDLEDIVPKPPPNFVPPDHQDSEKWVRDVIAFHEHMLQNSPSEPTIQNAGVRNLRLDLMDEEYGEYRGALEDDDLVEIADACVDMIYVAIGTMVAYGIRPEPIWDEVHQTNMQKEPKGAKRKATKPKGFRKPNVARLLRLQGFRCPMSHANTRCERVRSHPGDCFSWAWIKVDGPAVKRGFWFGYRGSLLLEPGDTNIPEDIP